jgi:hypothetical protein
MKQRRTPSPVSSDVSGLGDQLGSLSLKQQPPSFQKVHRQLKDARNGLNLAEQKA